MKQERDVLLRIGVGRRVESLFWAAQAAIFGYEVGQAFIRRPGGLETLLLALATVCSSVLFLRAWTHRDELCRLGDDAWVVALTTVQVGAIVVLWSLSSTVVNADTPLVVAAVPLAVYLIVRIGQGRVQRLLVINLTVVACVSASGVVGWLLFRAFQEGMEVEAQEAGIDPRWVEEVVRARIVWIHVCVVILLVLLMILVSLFSQSHRNVARAMEGRMRALLETQEQRTARPEPRKVELGAEIRRLRFARGRFGTRVLYHDQARLSDALLLDYDHGMALRRYFREIVEKDPSYVTVSVSHQGPLDNGGGGSGPEKVTVAVCISGLSDIYQVPGPKASDDERPLRGEIRQTFSAERVSSQDPVESGPSSRSSWWIRLRDRVWSDALGERLILQRPGFGLLSDAVTAVLVIVVLDAAVSVARLWSHIGWADRIVTTATAVALSALVIILFIRGLRASDRVRRRGSSWGRRDEYWLTRAKSRLLVAVSAFGLIVLAAVEDAALAERGILGSPRPLAIQFTIVVALVAVAAESRTRWFLLLGGAGVLLLAAGVAGVIDVDAGLDGVRPAVASVYWFAIAVALGAFAREVVLQIEQVFELAAEHSVATKLLEEGQPLAPAQYAQIWLSSVSDVLATIGATVRHVSVFTRGQTCTAEGSEWQRLDLAGVLAIEVRAVPPSEMSVAEARDHLERRWSGAHEPPFPVSIGSGADAEDAVVLRADFSQSSMQPWGRGLLRFVAPVPGTVVDADAVPSPA